MRLLLIPDPTSPNGEDAFCRELAKRAGARGHRTAIQPMPKAAPDEALRALSASGFAKDSDLVLVNSLQPAAFLAAKAAGKKTVVRLIDSYAGAADGVLEQARSLMRAADLVLAPSEHLAGVLRTWGLNGQVRLVPYAYDRIMAGRISVFSPPLSRQAFELVAACPLDETTRPGLETLLAALARLRLDCHAMIVGDGPALPALRERARQLLCRERVTFQPPMEHAALMELFRVSKAYVDACGVEGFPTLALHALSEGCPVIAARAGALPELIRHGENGLLFSASDVRDLSEAIVTLWSERGLSLKLIAEGVKTVGGHGWDRTAEAVFEQLETLAVGQAR
ncbi:MAG: glycosyltransferase family 4 protein [Elusimicrobia bacterium]|nr:glycosyltransferase family 4 protein [Elusimicrobiota bacterium]MDE2236450.1 glycosyltransferase family 4 protein [Elusimicrobiota bacterium]MDE2425059.1 glycosyltransferase family 4 protein [Elusimicrobiota bacterium]